MSDLISREALIESLNPEYLDTRKLIEQGETHLDSLAEGYTEVYRLIKTAPTVDAVEVIKKQWISVEGKLPKSGERVLFSDGVFVGEGYMSASGKWTRYNGKISAVCIDVYDVTHWMPLPETPEEVRK